MTGFLILFLVLLAGSAVVIFSGLFDHFKWAGFSRLIPELSACFSQLVQRIRRIRFSIADLRLSIAGLRESIAGSKSQIAGEDPPPLEPPDMSIFNCRVQTNTVEENGEIQDVFSVEICGSIQAPNNGCRASIALSLVDVTDEPGAPVQTWLDVGTSANGPNMSAFGQQAELGRLPQKVTTLSEWTSVAQIRIDRLVFARRGRRALQLEASISSTKGGHELCHARCSFAYNNSAHGYLDLQENAERTKVLAVALAFAVSAADDELAECEVELIQNWARDNIIASSSRASEVDARKLEKVLSRTVAFFREGNRLDTHRICQEIVDLAPVAQRYDILDLCLYVARADGFVAVEESAILKDLAAWLEVDTEKFRLMMEKVLPIHMHEVKDVQAMLGLTSDMSRDKARRHLNKEYSRWNARVTNSDPGIQNQADQMLKLIMETRGQYTAEPPKTSKSRSRVAVKGR